MALIAACGANSAVPSTEVSVVGFLRAVPPAQDGAEVTMLEELQVAGFVPGRNLTLLGNPDEVYPDPADAEAAVGRWYEQGVDLIVALSSAGAAAAHRAAPDVNILFISNDPVAAGLLEDEAQPEGRMTGVTFRVPADRTLRLAHRVLPDLRTVGLAYPPADPAALANRDAVAAAAEQVRIALVTEEFTDADDVGAAVDRLVEEGIDVLLLSTSPTAVRMIAETGDVAAAHGLPVIANTDLADFALVALYPDSDELGRQMGRQAARLLTGSSPAAVPVEDPRRFLVRLHADMAAELGIELSDEVLREANEVVGS